jgi:hypothetical protein
MPPVHFSIHLPLFIIHPNHSLFFNTHTHNSINFPLNFLTIQTLMDFKSLIGNLGSSDKPSDNEEKKPDSSPSNSELLANAKLVSEAARFTYNKESDKVDKAKTAEAAADLLDAAESYGKLDKSGLGSYIDKAEDYLHNYGSSGAAPHKTAEPAAEPAAAPPSEPAAAPPAEPAAAPHAEPAAEEKSEGGGGYGQYMKMAEGLFKK